jgi:4-alpha-glucanotransferase
LAVRRRRQVCAAERLFDEFTRLDLAANTPLAAGFRAFVGQGGAALEGHSRFEAGQSGATVTYHLLPAMDRKPRLHGRAGALACRRHEHRTHLGSGDRSSTAAAARWRRTGDFLTGLTIGAPPDFFNPHGQNWGPYIVRAAGAHGLGLRAVLATLRAALRGAGGIRIDHAMGLMRLWLVPDGAPSSEGAYVSYPFERLAAPACPGYPTVMGPWSSARTSARCADFRMRCREAGIAGMDVLLVPAQQGRFSCRRPIGEPTPSA